MRTVPAGEFKAKCLAILDEVSKTGEPVLVTKRGKPVARIVAVETLRHAEISVASLHENLKGLLTLVGDPADLIGPFVRQDEWERPSDPLWQAPEK